MGAHNMRSIVIFTLCFGNLFLTAQNSQLSFEAQNWPEHTVAHYSKANWDGSNQGFISVYFKDGDWLESLKWHDGHNQATVVPAKIDHQSFNVVHFKNFRCQEGNCQQLGEMYWLDELEGYVLKLGEMSDTVSNIPSYWHSYDFDFASLMAAFLFKKDNSSHTFSRVDFQRINGNYLFGPMGDIVMEFKGTVQIEGSACNLYAIDGPGLNNRGGEIWFDQETKLLKGYKIQEPDESSYNSVDLKFLGAEKMSPKEWEDFKEDKY